MRRHWLVGLISALVLLVLAGCGGAKPTSTPAATAPGEPTRASEPAEPTAAPTEELAEPEPTEAPEPTAESDLTLDSRDAGLDQLDSYRVSWGSEWETTKDDKTTLVTWNWMEEYTSDPQALHFVWKSTEDGVDQASMEMWQIGDTRYMLTTDQDGETSCTSFSSSDPDSALQKGLFSPSMLGSLSGAKYAGTETVNGIRTRHYTYDESSANLAGFGKLSGETWVAVDGGYVVKDIVNWEGGAGLFGVGPTSGEGGKGNWTWELRDANANFAISPPEGCESATVGLPVLPDATDKTTMGDLTIYKTAAKPADVLAFYQKEMAAAGWAPSGDVQTMEGFSSAQFTKDGQTASINITSEGEGSQVMINVSKSE